MAKASIYFTLEHAMDRHMARDVKASLGGIPGVLSVAVGDGSDRISVDYDSTGTSPKALHQALSKRGLAASAEDRETHVM
ncbi:MAG: heavy-metal-associated domain-containing protein [Oscillospiraceae bacterium]|nr:heavy-metal-associated domain-containing protein [Oscillospiraceae bacterium]